MFRISKALLLMMTLTLGSALRCYYCGGYSPTMAESNSNTRYCEDSTFRGKEVQTREASDGVCVKRVSYMYGERFVQRYLGNAVNSIVKRSLDTLNAPTINSTLRMGPLVEETFELEGPRQSADGSESNEEELQGKKKTFGDLVASAMRWEPRGTNTRYAKTDQYYYCSKNKCNSAPRALASSFVTVVLMALAASILS